VPFPFSDLSDAKLCPAIALAGVGRDDWILCQITSSPYGDAYAILLAEPDFVRNSLRATSYARPGKLFTAHQRLLVSDIGQLKAPALQHVIETIVRLLRYAA
jgi:mRNA interferase MazF